MTKEHVVIKWLLVVNLSSSNYDSICYGRRDIIVHHCLTQSADHLIHSANNVWLCARSRASLIRYPLG